MGNSESNMAARAKQIRYTPEIAKEICERIANGETMRSICRDRHMPSWSGVYTWQRTKPDFAADLLQARDTGFDAIAEDILTLADEPVADDGEKVKHSDILFQRKIQIDAHFKLLSKWSPNRYGDQVSDGSKTQPITVNVNTHAGLAPLSDEHRPTE